MNKLVGLNSKISEAIDKLAEIPIVMVIDENNRLLGVISQGDVRRALERGISPEDKIDKIINRNPLKAVVKGEYIDYPNEDEIERVAIYGKSYIPVVNENGVLVNMYIVNSKKPSFNTYDLIIGGAGYLGSVIAEKLANNKREVMIFDNFIYGIHNRPNEFIKMKRGDILQIEQLTEAISKARSVVLLAGFVGDPASSINPKKSMDLNAFSTAIIADIAKYYGIEYFVFASSCSVYGATKGDEELTEESALNPVSIYANTKIISEKILMEKADSKFKPIIFRMGTLYGPSPRMRYDLVINKFAAKLANGEPIEIYGGNQWRPFIDVRDAAEHYIKAIEGNHKAGIYNIANVNLKIRDLGEIIKRIDDTANIKYVETKEDERNYRVNADKAKKEFGVIFDHPVEQSIIEIRDMPNSKEYFKPIYNNYEYLKLISN